MKTEEELWSLLREAYNMPYGSSQIALLEQIVQHADAGGFDELRFSARMQATTAYVHGGETAKSFVTFSWCRAEYDQYPERFDRQDEGLLLWHFKYMVAGLMKFPEVPLTRTYDVLDDMEQRFRTGGHSLQAVYAYRHRVAEHLGDPSVDDWFDKWNAAPRDDNSDCVGCDPTSKVYHLVARGHDEQAVELAQPVLAGRLTCVEQPQSILTSLLVPYLRTGRLSEAADAHRRAYRRIRGNIADMQSIGDHVMFCAQTGNELRGLEIVERHLGWLDKAPSPQAEMWFTAAAGYLLDRFVTAGRSDLTVRSGADEVTVGVLAPQLAAQARALAARFDARNGTGHIGELIEARLTAAPFVEHLPLSAVDRSLSGSRPLAAEPPSTSLPQEPSALLDRAMELFHEHRIGQARVAWQHFDEVYGEPTPELVARRLDGQGLIASVDGRSTEAEESFRAAADAYRAVGRERDALVAEARAARSVDDEDRQLTALAELETLTGRLIELGDPECRAEARLRLAYPLAQLGRVDEALATIAAAAEEEIRPLLRAEVEARRAHCLLVMERYEDAGSVAAQARRLYAELGDPPAAAVAALVHGHALANLDELDAATEAFDAALRMAVERDMRLSARVGRGRSRLAAGKPTEAIDDLVEAVADHVAHGEEMPAAILQYDLATAYHQAGQLVDAAEAAETAIEVLDRIGAQEAADRTRYLLSRTYRDMDEPDQALALLTTLANNLDGFDNLPGRGQIMEESAQILYHLDRDAQAGDRFGAAAEAFRAAGLGQDELRNRRWRALSLRWAEDVPASIAALAEADTLAAGLISDEPWLVWERAMLTFDGARVLIGANQPHEALARIGGTAERFRSIGAYGESLQADLLHGELLLRMGSPEDAETLLRAVLGAAPQDSPARQNSAWLLCEALEALGRSDEAAEIRETHHLE